MWIWLYVRKRWCSSWERQGANVEQVKTSETKWCNFSWFLVLRWTFAGIRRRRVLIRRMCVKGAAVSGSSDIHVYKINKRWRWWRPVMTFQAFLFCSLSFIHCWASLERPCGTGSPVVSALSSKYHPSCLWPTCCLKPTPVFYLQSVSLPDSEWGE